MLALPMIGCGGGRATAATLGGDAALAGADATQEARADSASSDASSSGTDSALALDSGLDAASKESDARATATDGPMDVDADAGCEGPPCPTPVFCPPGGSLALAAMGVTITTPGLPHSIIYYTTDGTLPTHASAMYTSPILVSAVLTMHAIAFEPCVCTDSTPGAAQFTVIPPTDGEAADCGAHD